MQPKKCKIIVVQGKTVERDEKSGILIQSPPGSPEPQEIKIEEGPVVQIQNNDVRMCIKCKKFAAACGLWCQLCQDNFDREINAIQKPKCSLLGLNT